MRIAALIAYGLIIIPGFFIGLPFALHLLTWPFDDYRWQLNLGLFFVDLAIVAAVVARYKKVFRYRQAIACISFLVLCVPIIYVFISTKGEIMSDPLFVLPSIAFIVMYVWSLLKPSAKTSDVFQKDCCKEA